MPEKKTFSQFLHFDTVLFQLKTGGKAHTDLHQGKTSMTKRFHILITSCMRGDTLAVVILITQTSKRQTIRTVGNNVGTRTNDPTKCIPLERHHQKRLGRVGNMRSSSPIGRNMTHPSISSFEQ